MPNDKQKSGGKMSSEDKNKDRSSWSRRGADHSNKMEEEGTPDSEEKLIDNDDEPLEDEYD